MPSSTLPAFIREQAAIVLSESPVFLDTETTGLGADDSIVEIAIIGTDGTVLFESCVNPGFPMDAEVIGIHGITNEELADAPTWDAIAPRVSEILRGRIVVAHCAEFDDGMLRSTSARASTEAPEPASWFCTMQLMLPTVPDAARVSLARSMRLAGANDDGVPGKPHRAAYDAQCCRRLLMGIANGALADATKVA